MDCAALVAAVYDDVPAMLEAEPRVAAFPDGSVDAHVRIRDRDGELLTRGAVLNRISTGRSTTVHAERRGLEPGGQAVNAARQAHALGDDVWLDGCLDHEVLALPFETRSHGEPSRIDVHAYEDGDVTYASISDDVAGWTHESLEPVPSADAYVCGNWASVDGMTGSLAALSDRLDGDVFVFDPGDWTAAGEDPLRRCTAALSVLDDALPVYVSVNGEELGALADALDVADEPCRVRSAAGVTGVVRHETAAAAGATRDDRLEVPNLDVSDPTRRTGAGDRFDAGLAHGLAASGNLAAALALANCCASYYVATGTTGRADELADTARGRVEGVRTPEGCDR